MKEIYQKVIDHYGVEAQKEKATEELRELYDEIKKDTTWNIYNRINMISEISDVYNMLAQLKIIYDISDTTVENEMVRKMQRTLRDIEHKKEIGG